MFQIKKLFQVEVFWFVALCSDVTLSNLVSYLEALVFPW